MPTVENLGKTYACENLGKTSSEVGMAAQVLMRLAIFRPSRHSIPRAYLRYHSSTHLGSQLSSLSSSRRHYSTAQSLATLGNEVVVKHRLETLNISLPSYDKGGYRRVLCPKCEGGIKGERTLAVNISPDGGFAMWNCLRSSCLYSGHIGGDKTSSSVQGIPENGSDKTSMSVKVIPENDGGDKTSTSFQGISENGGSADVTCKLNDLCEDVLYYFHTRKITKKTLSRNGVKETSNQHGQVIAFPYRMNGKIVNCKYRTLGKLFWQEKQSLKILYGLDDIVSAREIIIVEGEIDKLSMEEAGFLNCVSVPDGAPAKVSETSGPPTEAQDKKFSYIWNCKEYFEKASRIILATDADPPGQALAEELARRLGRERCWRVQWPKKKDGKKVFKDANEVLVELGVEALRTVVETAELYPIRGLFTFSDFFKDLDDYYRVLGGDETGVSTGWPSLDDYYKIVPGELTLVTGVPSSGKSEWIDALMCNLVQLKGWTFGLCSMENKVREHGRKLLEKYSKKPFFDALYSGKRERMSPQELAEGKQWLNDNFYLIRCEDDELPSVEWVLKLARAAVMRHGIRGLVIDPYNELDHQRGPHQTETEYVSLMLTKIKRFAQHHSCHVWFVAHPRQMQYWQGEAPNLYDISGSAHFVNKCDNGLVIHRNRDPTKGPLDRVEILVRKARNKVSGTLGEVFLTYDRVTGLYFDSKLNS